MSEVFEFTEYRAYLKSRFPASGDLRGRRRELAEALSCQTSFISLVLTERAHFNEDMAYLTAQFLLLSPDETAFFMLLYHRSRAGTPALNQYYTKQIKEHIRRRSEVKERVGVGETLTPEVQAQYYSDWSFSALHTAVLIPELRTVSALAEKLHLKKSFVAKNLSLLVEWKLLEKNGDEYLPGLLRIHLGSDSPFVVEHHRNWHLEALRAVTERRSEDLNYSGALCMSREDVEKIRAIFLSAIEKTEKQIIPSPNEQILGFALSIFNIG